MDEVESAIVSVSAYVDVERAGAWFEVVCGAYDDFGENWNLFKDALVGRAYEQSFTNEAAESFVAFMESGVADPSGVLRQLCARRDELPQLYERLATEELHALTDVVDEDSPEVVRGWDADTAAEWYVYLTQTLGDGWPGWSGEERDWDEFKQYFLAYAAHAGVTQEASNLLISVEGYPDKIAGFREHGIVIAGVATPVTEQPSDLGDRFASEVMAPALADALREVDGAEHLSMEEVLQVLEWARAQFVDDLQ